MAIYDSFAPSVNSTGAGLASNPASTGVVVAAIDSTQVGGLTNGLSGPRATARLCRLTAIVGGNSSMAWRLEQSASSTITDAPRMSVPVWTPAHQAGQYSVTMQLQPGDLVRARTSDTGTGTFTAFLQLDPLA